MLKDNRIATGFMVGLSLDIICAEDLPLFIHVCIFNVFLMYFSHFGMLRKSFESINLVAALTCYTE